VCVSIDNMALTEQVGRLIGRQGIAVKQLQAETKTRIDVLDADPHSMGRVDNFAIWTCLFILFF
jgi:rRNA processing protein Krr1/Pno1